MAVKVELFDVKDAEEKDDAKYNSREQTFSSLWSVPAEIRYLGLFQLSYLGLAWKTTMQQVQILWGIHGLELFVVVVLFCWLTDCNRQSSSISTYDNLF